MSGALAEHLASGVTTLCRCWAITRSDGSTLGFTDHDGDLSFEGIHFRAASSLTGRSAVASTGLDVDGGDILGALQGDAITEADIASGLYDSAEVTRWLVNWAAPEMRTRELCGRLGEIRRAGSAFEAELRGMTDALNQPMGRAYQRLCPAQLGDTDCRVDLQDPALRVSGIITEVIGAGALRVTSAGDFKDRWFSNGLLEISGRQPVHIHHDRLQPDASRRIETWAPLQPLPEVGAEVTLIAGCDKRAGTCAEKFGNIINFRGFPDLPDDEYLFRVPRPGNLG